MAVHSAVPPVKLSKHGNEGCTQATCRWLCTAVRTHDLILFVVVPEITMISRQIPEITMISRQIQCARASCLCGLLC